MIMSWFKLPFIALAMAGLQVTVTPPHPPPSHDEEAPSTSFEVVMKQRLGPSLVKVRVSSSRARHVTNRLDRLFAGLQHLRNAWS